VNAGIRFTVMRRADIFAGLHRVQDRGNGANQATTVPAFTLAQTFPLTYQSPLGRLSIRLHDKIRLNVGYQYYGYNEKFPGLFAPVYDYRAHTGYMSVLWSF
jgi:hypothetical protein